MGAKSDFCCNICCAEQNFCSNISNECKARLLFKYLMRSKNKCKAWLLFKHFGCKVRLLCNYYGCKARLLFKHLWCKARLSGQALLSNHWLRGSTGQRPERKKGPTKWVYFFWSPLHGCRALAGSRLTHLSPPGISSINYIRTFINGISMLAGDTKHGTIPGQYIGFPTYPLFEHHTIPAWNVGEHLFKHLECKERLFLKHFGCEDRLLY